MEVSQSKSRALRYNSGKLRLDLVPSGPINEVAKVLTFGLDKYEVHNWRKGMDWSTCIGAMKRHISAFEMNEDIDQESGCYHLAHAATNILFLLEYYKTHPELDDRYAAVKPNDTRLCS